MNISNTEEEKFYEQFRRKDSYRINPKEVAKLNRPFSVMGKIGSVLFMAVCILVIWRFTARTEQWYFLGGIMFVYLLIKEVLALCYVPCKKKLTKEYKVSCVITCYNENPESIVSIFKNILALDYSPYEVIFLDDGSKDTTAYEVAKSFAESHHDVPGAPIFNIVRFDENRGKRELLIDAFGRAGGDYIFLLDSDSEILPNALTELLRPFEDGKTTSCVGNIGILNKDKNFLTRLQSISYFGSFQLGRAAQSVTGDVVICSGAFSLHKKDFIMQNLEEFKRCTFLGVDVSAGDDRSLTAFSKMSGGKTRYQNTAYCETLVPTTWKKFQSQRRRWQRSAYITSLKTVHDLFPKKLWYLFWSFGESYFWLIAKMIFLSTLFSSGIYIDIVDIFLFFIIVMYKHNTFYLLYRPIRFLFIPVYFFAYGLSLTYTRIHAAITIKNDDWGTRGGNKKK
ncbi:MAG: glycosyltransferase family 2 protein [Defluviitaleaceae bacterium]|nr:glycosyltransferase family 2 protein [Defluviitaleaceae bacterium]